MMSPFTIARYSYGSNAAKQIFRRGATMIIGLRNKTSVQCRSQSSSYTSGNMHTKQMLYSGSEMFLCLQDQWRLQAMLCNTLHSLKLPAEALWYPQPAQWVSHCSGRSQNPYEDYQSHGQMVKRCLPQLHTHPAQDTEKPN